MDTNFSAKNVSTIAVGLVLFLGTMSSMLLIQPQAALAVHPTFAVGDVFVAVEDGKVQWRHPDGSPNMVLDTGNPGTFTTGMAFDGSGNLYVTNFDAEVVEVFDNSGNNIGTFGSGYNSHPESIVFESSGNAYVGQADGTGDILKFDSAGNSLASFDVDTEARGSDWINLEADECTMRYTSEGTSIKQFDVCNNTQLADYATNVLHGAAFALRTIPSTGDVLVADSQDIHRLSAGAIVATYDAPGEDCWFALNLDPDGLSFWSADFCTSDVYKFNIATGAVELSFNTGTAFNTVFGLVIRGEIGVPEICGDGIDNDGDGQVDEGCPEEICGDGIDNDGDGQIDENCEGRMTGGGRAEGTFADVLPVTVIVKQGFELHCDVNQSPNSLEVNWDGGNKFHLETLLTAACIDDPSKDEGDPPAGFDTYKGTGTGRCNGVPGATADWTFTDEGEPGTEDDLTMTIVCSTGILAVTGPDDLDQGNFQAHPE